MQGMISEQPATGMPLQEGYDLALWRDVRARSISVAAPLTSKQTPLGVLVSCPGCGGQGGAGGKSGGAVLVGQLVSTPQGGFGAAQMAVAAPGENGEIVLTGSTVSVYVAKLF